MDDDLIICGLTVCVLGYAYLLKQQRRRRKRIRRWQVRPENRENHHSDAYKVFLNMKENDPEQFFNFTRMDKDSFDHLVQLIHTRVNKRTRTFRAIPVEMRLAVTLHYLSQCSNLHECSVWFNIGDTTTFQIVEEVCQALTDRLAPGYPSEQQLLDIAEGFDKRWNIPHCIGSVGGKHITIHCGFSMVMMAIVDHNYRFVVLNVGGYESLSENEAIAKTPIGKALLTGSLGSELDIPKDQPIPGIEGEMPYFLVGCEKFPLKRNLMKPFLGKNLKEMEIIFNQRLLNSSQMAENAFGILAARWKVFRKTILVQPEKALLYASTAVCLHNFIMSREISSRYNPPGYADHYGIDGSFVPGNYRDGLPIGDALLPCPVIGSRRGSKEDSDVRNRLARYLSGATQPLH